jgi:hypothetical protein
MHLLQLCHMNHALVQPQLTLHLKCRLPLGTEVYVAGNFNDWYPDQARYRLTPATDGQYTYRFDPNVPLPATVEYKYVLGGWDHVELDRFGQGVPNRVIAATAGDVHDTVCLLYTSDAAGRPIL